MKIGNRRALSAGVFALSFVLACHALAEKPRKPGSSSSAGASRPSPSQPVLSPEKEQAFQALDLDGDGKVALAEAAGNAGVVMGFDRADRNHDGALDRKEFARLGQKPKHKQRASR